SKAEGAGMELQRGGQMLCDVAPVVSPGVEVELMRDFSRVEKLVKCLRARVEAELIFRSAIEANLQSCRTRALPHQCERAVALPERGVKWCTERSAQAWRQLAFLRAGNLPRGKFFDQRRAVRAAGREHLGVTQGHPQRSISAHGYPTDAAVLPPCLHAVVAIDKG